MLEKEKEELILKYLPLVRAIAYRIHLRLPKSVDFNDLVGYGILGLAEAVSKLDPSKRGSTAYIKLRVKGAIYDYLRSLDFLSRGLREKDKRIKNAMDNLSASLGREPTDEELAQHLVMSVEELEKDIERISFSHFLSLDELFSEGRSYEEVFSSSVEDPEEEVLKEDIREKVIGAIKKLSEKEQLVLQLLFYEELPLKAVADILGVSIARVSQIKAQALEKLRQELQKVL